MSVALQERRLHNITVFDRTTVGKIPQWESAWNILFDRCGRRWINFCGIVQATSNSSMDSFCSANSILVVAVTHRNTRPKFFGIRWRPKATRAS